MQKRLPLTIELTKVAQKRLDYVGFYPKQLVMRRLTGLVADVNSDIKATLSFAVDDQCLLVLTLFAEVELSLICQHSGRLFTRLVTIDNKKFSPVKNDKQAQFLPAEYDPIELDEDGHIDLLALVEDEIILSLPIVPVAKIRQCEASEATWISGTLSRDEERLNPFAKLAFLKKKVID